MKFGKISQLNWVIVYAILLHVVWGITLLTSPAPLGVTAIYSIIHLGITSGQTAGYFYLLVALLATIGLTAPKPAGFFFLLPQQLVLVGSAFGAAGAMVSGTFLDGTVRGSAFLIADQAPVVLLALLHTVSMYTNFLWRHQL